MIHIEVQTNGKLFLTGEYNILEKKGVSIIYSVSKRMIFNIEESLKYTYKTRNLISYFDIVEDEIVFEKDNSNIILKEAIKNALLYVKSMNINLVPFSLEIKTELEDKNGNKFGFGSSSAIIIGVIKSILKFYKIEFDEFLLFKLGVLTQYDANKITSGGDLASACFGKMVFYKRYNKKWLEKNRNNPSLLNKKWKDLKIFEIKTDLKFKAIWTGKSYKTKNLEYKITKKEYKRAKKIVKNTYQNLITNNYLELKENLKNYQRWLENILKVDLLNTVELKKIIEITNKYSLGAKISGAGGGDSVILLYPEGFNFYHMEKELLDNNLYLMDIWGKKMKISKRKDEHVKYAKLNKVGENDFDLINLEHNSLPNISMDQVNLKTNFLGFEIDYPFYINAMTGGSRKTKKINEKLALYAKEFNIPLILGSSSAFLKDETLLDTYLVARQINKDGIIVANVSANATLDDAKLAVKMINADALSIHINVIQELVMKEGDRDFTKWTSNIKDIVNNIKVPVIVKEVGFGMSKKTITTLENLGVKYIDVSGKGGTNFAFIERVRSKSQNMIFENVGISTVKSLENAKDSKSTIFASGGIRNALDIYKALMLGASAVGLSKYFLNLTKYKDEVAFMKINNLINDLKKCFVIYK